MSNNVLITGGMGFIGKYLTKKLLSDTDYNIVIVDNLSTSKLIHEFSDAKRVIFYNQSFEDWQPKNLEFKQIYHLVSPVGPLGVLEHKGVIAEQILGQLYKVANLAIEMNAKLLEVSTSEVYGRHPDNEELGQEEDIDKIVPSDLTVRLEYGVSKLLCEIILRNLSRDNALEYVCIRPFNIVGPKQNGELGFIIPRFIKQSITGSPFTVYGDGSQKRTLTHVSDFVDAIFLCMEGKNRHRVYNVGNPENVISILELARRIKTVLNSKSDISFVKPEEIFKDFSEAWNKIPNIDRIQSEFGWRPRYDLAAIIDEVGQLKGEYIFEE